MGTVLLARLLLLLPFSVVHSFSVVIQATATWWTPKSRSRGSFSLGSTLSVRNWIGPNSVRRGSVGGDARSARARSGYGL